MAVNPIFKKQLKEKGFPRESLLFLNNVCCEVIRILNSYFYERLTKGGYIYETGGQSCK